MSFRTTVLLLSFVVLSLSQTPPLFHGTGTVVVGGAPYTAAFGPFNVHDTASLTVTTSHLPVYVCIVYSAYGLPNGTQYHEDNCMFYQNTTASFTAVVPLRNQEYVIGVFLSSKDSKEGNTTVEVTLDGADCGKTGYWDGSACKVAVPIPGWNKTVTAQFKNGETKFFSYIAPNYVGTMKLSYTGDSEISAIDSVMWARYHAVPSKDYYDAIETDGSVTIVSARPGLWVFGVHAAHAGTGSFQLSGQVCGSQSGGVGCMIAVNNITNNPDEVLQQRPMFFKIDAVPNYPLIVSITTNNGSNIPYLYATRGVIPTKESADILNCNGDYCDEVRSISFNVTTEEEWFIGVFPSVDTGNQSFGIWWNSTCVVGCTTDNHGTCAPSGRCDCEIDYEGIACSVSKGLGPQYIVLIIIAALVVSSAVIGFVAWAYMRRKRAAYEIVS